MIRASQLFTVNEKAQRIKRGGRTFLVAPVVASVGGVMNGEWGPAEEFAKTIIDWDGQPITINHPTNAAGEYISAHDGGDPVGFLSTPRVEDGKFKAMAWFDVSLLETSKPGKKIISNLEAGILTEVSTGYFCDREETPGDYNGVPFVAIQRNIQPDHLAILPDGIGACSVREGCGIPRANQQKEGNMPKVISINEEVSLDEQQTRVYDAWHQYVKTAPPVPVPAGRTLWVRSVYPDFVIVNGHPDGVMKYPYVTNEDGGIEFGDPVRVEIVYQPVGMAANEGNVLNWLKSLINPSKRSKPKMNKTDMIAQITANGCKLPQATLETMTDEDLQIVLGHFPAAQPQQPKVNATQPQPGSPSLEEITKAIAAQLQPLQAEITQLKTNMESGPKAEKASLIAKITANGRVTIKPETLEKMDLGELRSIAREFEPADFSGRGFVKTNQGEFITDEEFEAAQ